ncbi:hypothetical protein ANN_20111 [Periplaneta americana]|uniref:BRISC complex subunit FAM175B helical domain-containing protein n=1 Tax=Periplaneta americana TaxID=6978 RepID=A0ABQ8SC59_PERAM|nr:hypothetical protein ANN_20111 [Periplaneta americana]
MAGLCEGGNEPPGSLKANKLSYYDLQEGFLLGEVVSHVTDTISDSQMRGEKTETLISVNSLMPISNAVTFYNGIGKVNHEKLKEFLKEKEKEVVGWYSFRRNSVLSPHLREKLLHKELCSFLSHLSSEHFTMCLLNTSVSTPGSTHVFNHKFIRYRHRMFEALPVQIHNLGEAPQSEYKLVPSTACLSDSFNNIISSLRASSEMSSDASLVCNIQKALQEHLRNLINDVEHSERKIAELEREVDSLRSQPGPISNEILLPQILREEVPTTITNSSNMNSTNFEPPVSVDTQNVVPAKQTKSQNTHHASAETNHVGAPPKDEAPADRSNSPDAFAFVTEMKIQMSQPQNAVPQSPTPPASSVENSSVGSKKPQSERGRGVARGIGRGVRKTQQSKNKDGSDASPNLRQVSQSQALDTSKTPVRGTPNMNSATPKTRMAYSQAVKRPGVAGDSVVTKSPAVAQATSANGSTSSTDAQK